MKSIITPQEAIKQITSGHLSQLKGLDVHDFTYIFDNASEVTLLTYFQNSPATLATVIEENETEIRFFAEKAKGVMLQMICGHGNDLSMNDMTIINTIQNLFPDDTDFSWDVKHSESTEYELRIDLYIVTQ